MLFQDNFCLSWKGTFHKLRNRKNYITFEMENIPGLDLNPSDRVKYDYFPVHFKIIRI